MYLEKLKVQGFKSFAAKNEMPFVGMLGDGDKRGITAIVGPNGSGKSNVADAVRWALGEQSMKTLRGKKSEDIIFSGSSTKGKLGMAEVSLFLNNEDKRAPVDYAQIVITRRLYRNGDSEYMINGSRVRLGDIQMLLAKASFGQKTYSVIGQGMVEGFLNTTLAERKEFFDEATGVKQFQIKRDEALNKLRSSYENLGQTQMLLTEIEPRLKSLTRQVNKLHKRGGLEDELRSLQFEYYGRLWHDNNNEFSRLNSEYLKLEKSKLVKDEKIAELNRILEKLKNESREDNKFLELRSEISKKQSERNILSGKINKIEAQIELKLESEGKFDLSFLLNKKEELLKLLNDIKIELQEISLKIEDFKKRGQVNIEARQKTEEKINALNLSLEEINLEIQKKINKKTKLSGSEKINKYLNDILTGLNKLKNSDNLMEIKSALEKMENQIREVISAYDKNDEKVEVDSDLEKQWKEIREELSVLNNERDKVSAKINNNNLDVRSEEEHMKLLKAREEETKNQLEDIERKLKQQEADFDENDLELEKKKFKNKLAELDTEISLINEKINETNSRGAAKRDQLFAIQKELQSEQEELNAINNKLNAIKVNSARYETKLEDLEIEIRAELDSLRKIKERKIDESLDIAEAGEKIKNLKKQLEMIGGIDPEIENEYNETKERFDFLSGQEKDFMDTATSLEKIIKDLDIVIRKKFDKEFKLIAGKFEDYFKILFSGGSAKIIKVLEKEEKSEEEDEKKTNNKKEEAGAGIKKIKFLQKHNATGLAGIEIQATPPGKKITSVSMLSGGERALTAIALICAIISANPSPFVVLDEVDAALDEANSERLAKILDDLSHKTQFIIITHNRAPMRKANILYGVTMGDDGVSKIISVKFDEFDKIS